MTRPRVTSRQPVLGVAIVAHHIGDIGLYLDAVDRIADLGANALVVVTPMFQEEVDSSQIRYLRHRCPTDRQLIRILRHARERGLITNLQPIVLIENPGENDWRGVISPRDWEAWWTSYRQLIERFLVIANAAEIDLFTVGSELNTTETQHERWEEIVTAVRSRFPGQLTYSANWDRYRQVEFWPLVDIISVSSYFELQRDDPDAPEAALLADWIVERDRLLQVARNWDKPLMLSEVGYPSLPWAGAHPWNYVAPGGTAADHEAQARCYRAFLAAWSGTVVDRDSRALGFFCYHWDPYHEGQSTDTGYGFRGKPAAEILRRGFASIRGVTPE